MKVKFEPSQINKKPQVSFDIFAQKITKSIKKRENIDLSAFSRELNVFGDIFEKQDNKPIMNKLSKKFAERLVGLGENNLAGIIYSFLIKFNHGNTEFVKEIATNALAIAKRLKDPIHTMARTRDLTNIYRITENGSSKHINALYNEKRALMDVINNYDNISKKHKTIKTELKPKENYEKVLCSVLAEIAKFKQKDNPKQALEELKLAKQIISKFEPGNISEQIDKLLKELS